VPDNPYDAVPYPTHPKNETHPDRLAAVATLFGMAPAPVTRCRVLEIGCGDGGNLIPMAYYLPHSEFTGVDLAEAPIDEARRTAAALELANVRLIAADLRTIGADYGAFDYVIAHGIYSWVPPEVRDALLRLCAERLAPQGIALVSYNAYPGRHARQMLREMMLYHARRFREPARQIEEARSFLQTLAERSMAPAPWRTLLEQESKLLLEKDAASFWHDDLAPINDPIYFHEFAAHAAAHGLQYLGDADAHLMFDPRRALAGFEGDATEREQCLDFLRCRRFRQTLLCRSEVALDRNPGPDLMPQFLFAAPARLMESGEIEGLNGVRIAPGHEALRSVVAAMGDSYPLPVPFDDLVPYAGGADLTDILFALVSSGFATFHVHDFPCEESVTERPRASRLARYQAEHSASVTSACHAPVELDEAGRRMLLLLDGTRGAAEMDAPFVAWLACMGLLEG
jgi:SAM-dependent methyltransferase